MITIAIANRQGGIGKTATTYALAVSLAELGYRVLLVDSDPQGSLTYGSDESAWGSSLAEVLGEASPGTLPSRRSDKSFQ